MTDLELYKEAKKAAKIWNRQEMELRKIPSKYSIDLYFTDKENEELAKLSDEGEEFAIYVFKSRFYIIVDQAWDREISSFPKDFQRKICEFIKSKPKKEE